MGKFGIIDDGGDDDYERCGFIPSVKAKGKKVLVD